MTTSGAMPVLATGLTVESPAAGEGEVSTLSYHHLSPLFCPVCLTQVSVMIPSVLSSSGKGTASTPGSEEKFTALI